MQVQFQNLTSYDQVIEIMTKSSSEDGENISFELKGTNGKIEFDKDFKEILAKEICAFANTYGGILCIHFGEKVNIKKFENENTKTVFQSLESWIRDSLEPRHLGIDIKLIDGLVLIFIPQSKTKPHRTATKSKTYYYRHTTQSEPMPEIMISSMYRSQDYLSTNSEVSLHRTNNQLSFRVKIFNLSNIPGTSPKIHLQIYAKGFAKQIEWQKHIFIDRNGLNSFRLINNKKNFEIPFISIIDTNLDFSNKILYPLDSLELGNYSNQIDDLDNIIYYIVHIDYFFKESQKISKTVLLELLNNTTKYITTTDKNTLDELVQMFNELTKK